MTEGDTHLSYCRHTRGRALLISERGSLYVARGYTIERSDDFGATWNLDCRIPARGWKPWAARVSIGARLLRFNIQSMRLLQDGTRVAVARDGVYVARQGETEMRRSWQVLRGSRPINLSVEGNRVVFGEYGGAEMDSVEVKIYCSDDGGEHFEQAYAFPRGDIHHLHNVVVDRHEDHYWVLAGDHGRTPGIAALSKDFRTLEWVARGSQMARAVAVLVRRDYLIYGSDTELEPNYIIRLEKKTGRCERVAPIDGSSLYAADIGATGFISSCVEPSAVNKVRAARLYGSTDDETWTPRCSLAKDRWHSVLFQYGLIVLPYVGAAGVSHGMFSGQALADHHDRVSIFRA